MEVHRRRALCSEKGKEEEKGEGGEGEEEEEECLNVCLHVQVYPKRGRSGTLMRDHDAAVSLEFFLIICDLSPF